MYNKLSNRLRNFFRKNNVHEKNQEVYFLKRNLKIISKRKLCMFTNSFHARL